MEVSSSRQMRALGLAQQGPPSSPDQSAQSVCPPDATRPSHGRDCDIARLIRYKIDHLDSLLSTDRMSAGVESVTVEEYLQTSRA